MGLLNFKRYKAKIFNEKGEHLKDIWFSNFAKTFSYKGKAFNVKTKGVSSFDSKGLLFDTRYYIYNISNPDPILLDKKSEPVMEPDLYNIMLETKVAQQLNNVNKTGLADFFSKPKNIIIGLIIIVLVYLLSTGQLQSIISGGA